MPSTGFKYNPGFHDDDEIAGGFVVRLHDLELIIDVIRSNSTSNSNRHVLIIGPRGYGKTTLARRLVATMRTDEQLTRDWLPIVYGEESYNITSAGEFWLEAVYHLDKEQGSAELHQQYRELSNLKNETELRENALEFLISYSRRENRRLVLVIENLNMLFDSQMSADEGWVIRHTLQNVPEVMLLATATTSFEELESADRGLFEQFKTHQLRPLTTQECADLWAHCTGETLELKKIRPIQILTGGSPRLLRILCDYAIDNSLSDLMSKLSLLVDQYTDYFKSQLESLPTKERKVFAALLEMWDPASTKEIASVCRMPVNIVSALLTRLSERGAIAKLTHETPSLWQASERLFNIYYLMRRRGAPSSRVHALVKFMTVYYETDQLAERAAALAREACSLAPENRVDHFIALSGIIQKLSPGKRYEVLKLIPEEVARDPSTPHEFSNLWEGRASDIIAPDRKFRDQSVRGSLSDISFAGSIKQLLEQEKFDLAQERCLARLEESPRDMAALLSLGVVYGATDKYPEAEDTYRRALIINDKDDRLWALLGDTLATQSKFVDAANCFETASGLKPNNSEYLRKLGLLSERLGRDDTEVESYFRKAIDANPQGATSWISLGKWLWRHKETPKEAGEAFQMAVKVEPKNRLVWETFADFLQEQKRYSEAEEAIKMAREIEPTSGIIWSKYADVISHDPKRRSETVAAYEEAVKLSRKRKADILVSFGRYLDRLHEHSRAEIILREATEVDPSNGSAWLRYGQHLIMVAKLKEAEAAIRMGLETSPTRALLWSSLGEVLAMQGRDEEAEPLLLKGVDLSKTSCGPVQEMGKFLANRDRNEEAVGYLREALARNGECLCAADVLSRVLNAQGKGAEGETVLRIMRERKPGSAWPHLLLGNYLRANDPKQAMEEYMTAVRMSDGHEGILSEAVQFILRDFSDQTCVLTDLKKVATMVKQKAGALNVISWAIHERAKDVPCNDELFEYATLLAQEATRLKPDSWPYHHTLGFLMADRQRVSEVLEEIKFLAAGLSEEHLEEFLELCIVVGRIEPHRLLAELEKANSRHLIEPLIVSLKIVTGCEVNVAQEVLEVARDLANQISAPEQGSTELRQHLLPL